MERNKVTSLSYLTTSFSHSQVTLTTPINKRGCVHQPCKVAAVTEFADDDYLRLILFLPVVLRYNDISLKRITKMIHFLKLVWSISNSLIRVS